MRLSSFVPRFAIVKALVLRPLVREKTRTAVTIAGIAVGVAVIVAIELANQSALRAFRESIDAISGKANYEIVPEAGALDERVLKAIEPLWRDGVRFAPIIDVEGVASESRQPIRLLAVDLLSDLHFRDYRYARISGLRGTSKAGTPDAASLATYLDLFRADSVIVPLPFATEHHLTIGSPLTLDIAGKERTMVVRGILEATGPAIAFNGAIAICDIATAQSAFGLTGKLTRVDMLVPEADETRILARVQRALPPAVRVERPSRRNDRVEKMLRAFHVNLFALAGVALLVGMFLVYNTVLISILRRRRDVGIVKTIGVTPAQIFTAFFCESLLFGALGSLFGLGLGVGLARAILQLIGRTINTLYVTSQPEAVSLTPGVIALGVSIGIALSLLAAIQPAVEAAQVRPSLLIRAGSHQRVERARRRMLILLAIGSFALATGLALVPPVGGIPVAGYASVLFVVTGFSLLAPSIVHGVAGLSAAPLAATVGIVGRLAAASLPASLRRTSIATAALSLATGMMVAVALMVGSFRVTVNTWIDQTISSDLWLRPARGLTNAQSAVFPAAIVDELRRVPFIAAMDPVRGRDVIYRDGLVTIGSGDFSAMGEHGTLPMIEPRSAKAGLDEGRRRGGVFISESFSLKYGKRVGDTVELPTAHGRHAFPVTGVYRDYSNDRGTVFIDRDLYIRLFDDDAVNTVVLYLRPGVDHNAARIALEKEFGPKYHAFAITNAEIRKEVTTIFDQTFMITYALLAIAIVVAVLGIINTLAALILERTRELALLRIGGMTSRELQAMLLLESALLGLAATITGVVMGYVLSWILIHVINRQSFGWTIAFHTPIALIIGSLATTFFASCVAGIVPARLASRIDFASAIKSE